MQFGGEVGGGLCRSAGTDINRWSCTLRAHTIQTEDFINWMTHVHWGTAATGSFASFAVWTAFWMT